MYHKFPGFLLVWYRRIPVKRLVMIKKERRGEGWKRGVGGARGEERGDIPRNILFGAIHSTNSTSVVDANGPIGELGVVGRNTDLILLNGAKSACSQKRLRNALITKQHHNTTHHTTTPPHHHTSTITPSHHLNISTSHHLTISPSHHLTISPSHHHTLISTCHKAKKDTLRG